MFPVLLGFAALSALLWLVDHIRHRERRQPDEFKGENGDAL